MAKAPKRRRDPVRQRVRTKATLTEGRHRVSLATSPQAGDNVLAHDVELAKAALLYADEVEMVGLGVALFEKVRQYTAGDRGMLGLMLELDDEALTFVMNANESQQRRLPAGFRTAMELFSQPGMRQIAETLGPEAQEFREALDGLEEINEGARPFIANLLEEAGAAELAKAIDARVVRVADLDVSVSSMFRSHETRSGETDAQIASWVAVLLERLQDRSSRLLFDDASAGLVEEMLGDGRLQATEPNLRLARQAALGAGLIARLPAFPQAPMDELLDLRRDLADPLVRYRGAVISYSKELPSVLGPNLNFEVDQMWEERVAPAVSEIEERLTDHGLVRDLFRVADTNDLKKFVWTSIAGVGVATVTDVRAALLGSAVATGNLAVDAVINAFRDRGGVVRDVKRHELFYLYETNRRLAG